MITVQDVSVFIFVFLHRFFSNRILQIMLILQSLKFELLLHWKNEKCALKNTNLIKWTEASFYFFYKIQLNDLTIKND